MGAVWYRARTDIRRGALATVAITLLIGVVGAVTLGAVAGARRSREAVPTFVDYSRPATAAVFINPALPFDELNQLAQDLTALPEWDAAGSLNQPVFTVRAQHELAAPTGIVASALGGGYLDEVERPIIVDGRLPDPDDAGSIAVNETFADVVGLKVGDELAIRSVRPENLDQIANAGGSPDPDGEDHSLVVTGVTRHPTDLTYDAQAQPGTAFAAFSYQVFLTRAFWERHGESLANYGTGVFGRVETDDAPALEAAALDVGGDNVGVELSNPGNIAIASTQRGVDFEANALLLFAAVVGLTGAVLVGQTLGRQLSPGQHEVVELSAVGLRRVQRAAVPLFRAAFVAVVGATLAVGGALALSPAAPIGVARQAEVDPGLEADAAVLLLGGIVIAASVLVFAGLVAWLAARLTPGEGADQGRARRPSRVVRRLAEIGAPVSMVAGVRLALERGRGRRSVPVGSALGVTISGLFAVSAALVFSASLQDVIQSPTAQGWNWDVTVGNYSGPDGATEGQQTLETLKGVATYRGWTAEQISVGDLTLYIGGLGPGDKSVGPPVLEGRLPQRADEIALGPGTLADLGMEVGDRVAVEGRGRVEAQIVGVIVPTAVLDSSMTLVRGGAMTLDGLRTVTTGDPQDPTFAAEEYLVRFADDVDREALVTRLRSEFPGSVLLPTIPADIENLRRVQRLPNLVAALVAFLAIATLVNALVTAVRRRRRELGLLATLGFRSRQLGGTVAWQATTVAVIGLAVGIPLGVAAGRAVWRLVVDPFASSLEPTVPTAEIAALVVVWVVVANAVALLPARSAARTHPAEALRSE